MDNNTPDKSEMKAEFARGFFAGLDHIANFINSLDSSAIYSEWRTARASSHQVPDMVGKVLREALAFVEEIERREDTHYLVGGHITDAIAALKASGEE